MIPKKDVPPFLLGLYLQEQNISSQIQARATSTGHEKCFYYKINAISVQVNPPDPQSYYRTQRDTTAQYRLN
jgi:ferric iron reductase protein FhuF